ncbi:MAG: hypothetical protein KME21_06015 [Desmonostoc vinosum HA7617-LM4]|jgi:hypothetical protein|nr:hypothetical protein [Desmonostoc vinosum HA7617-LM4]
MVQNSAIGVYFSANDVVYEWAIAFLNSFRTYNPDLRLILIPFNDQCDRLLQLSDIYNFEVFNDTSLSFSRLEAIGQAFELGYTPTGPYWFRRYASFWGVLDYFIYLDARQLILADLKPILEAIETLKFDFLYYDCAIDQVYEQGTFRQNLIRKGRGRGFNSGRWAARKGLFSLEEFEQLAESALKIRNQLNPRNTDQAFINYCCDLKPIHYGHIADVLGGICQNGWAKQPGKIYQKDEKYYLWDYGGSDHKKRLILLHWAGISFNSIMPERSLFKKYRLLKSSWLSSAFYDWKNNLLRPINFLKETVRRNRLVNTFYHKIKNKF